MKKIILGAACLLVLSGCVHQGKTPPRSALTPVSGTQVANVPLDNQCVKDFAVLKKMNPSSFSLFRGQFDDINRVYAIYQRDALNFGKDPKELLSMELGAKLNQVCSRVKFAVYTEVQKKLTPVSEL